MKRAALIALLFTAACASHGNGDIGSGAAPLGALAGSEWVMLSEAGGETPPTIVFAQDRASGHAGCNRWFGAASASDQGLEFSGIGLTRMMCPPPLMETESAFTTVLNETRGFRVENGELVLYDIGGTDLARFRRTN